MSVSAAAASEKRIAELASIIGPENLRTDLRSEGPALLVCPGDAQQIAEVLQFASASGLVVVPMGSGSKLGWGNPVAPGILLSLERMHALREHVWADMTCTVEAGSSWAAMQSCLRQHGQMVALDPLWPERATVGGIVATNDGGGLRLKYGGLRDLIIGMTVVLADGTIARSGGKVVKNVAGYDLHKLMTGSFGTLGVIAQVTFRLHPVEAHVLRWSATAPEASLLAAPLQSLLHSELSPSCIQLRGTKQSCALDVRIAARPECMDACAARVRALLGESSMQTSDDAAWSARQALLDDDSAVILKLSVLPGEVSAMCAELQRQSAADGVEIAWVAQATGLITAALRCAPDAAVALIELLRARLRPSGGSVVALQVPDVLRGRFDVWDAQAGSLPLMREIKRRFDPGRILNPGRFAGNV